MNIREAKELLQRYQKGVTNSYENKLVEQWYNKLIETGEWQWDENEKEQLQQLMESRLLQQINNPGLTVAKQVSFFRSTLGIAASVIFILFLGAGLYFLTTQKSKIPDQPDQIASNDVKAPASSKAMITLADGRVIYLDSTGKGALATQGNVNLVKLENGEIAYQPVLTGAGGELQYNSLQNPRGSKVINIVLSDGTKVWLNSGSSLTYPVAFIEKERKVAITGEAYFEVAHNAASPFIVSKAGLNIRVLGTHFNVNAYDDETEVKVTLLEGSVKVNSGAHSGILKPGQQAQVAAKIKVVDDADLNAVMAWKNGYFHFSKASLQDVLKQLSHWYDVDIIYEEAVEPKQFIGEMQRELNLSQVLTILEKNQVHFKIEGKKIRVRN